MDKWPFFGGLFAALAAMFEAIKRTSELFQYLMIIATFLMVASHVLHELGLPVADLLPFLPSIGMNTGN